MRVRVDIDSEDGLTGLDQVAVSRELSFGPKSLATVDAKLYHFVLDGGGLMECEVTRPAPNPGELVEVEFTTSAGGGVSVHVSDSANTPIVAADIVASFQHEHSWRLAHAATDDDGNAQVRGVIAGPIWLNIFARHFAESRFGPFSIAADGSDQRIELELQQAGALRGLCTHAGEPVKDFAVTVWGTDRTKPVTYPFSNRRDGRFELEGAPLGEVHVLAFSDQHAHSAVVDAEADVSSTPRRWSP
jgi:hypothetical protein